jgi:hypothetical protein
VKRTTLCLALAAPACLVPPPHGAETPSAQQERTSSDAAAPFVVWDGEGHAGGSGWASCEKQRENGCEARLEPSAGAGRAGSVGLVFTARGPEWLGFGWNWFNWWPVTAGSDISGYKTLSLWIKVAGEPGKTPEPFTLRFGLGGSALGGKDQSDAVALFDFEPAFADGGWHEVRLPLSAMLRGKGERFDTQRAWSFTLGAWNQGERAYRVFVDEIRFL